MTFVVNANRNPVLKSEQSVCHLVDDLCCFVQDARLPVSIRRLKTEQHRLSSASVAPMERGLWGSDS
ncbi:hypothetical protein EYF80_029161 [Liparis tanakae]|uniref:Uncharacterized protein n=1 Tax=Liparis tanakae TaxID=230148 RepID=A0A4Z2H503_9TELE|nr:hypothetical protein EYF80_029161 [Liparis tanakae]